MFSKSIASYFFSYVRIRISSWSVRTDPEERFKLELRTASVISPIVNLYLIRSSGEISIENSRSGIPHQDIFDIFPVFKSSSLNSSTTFFKVKRSSGPYMLIFIARFHIVSCVTIGFSASVGYELIELTAFLMS